MIKFFRKIRQRLISENRFSKYLIYAIGEIVLVVIGILIALQINLWNQERLNSKKEQTYLVELKTSLLSDKGKIKYILEFNKDKDSIVLGLMSIYDASLSNSKRFEVIQMYANAFTEYQIFKPANTAWNNFLSAENIDLIHDKELRNLLSEYYGNMYDGYGQDRVRDNNRRIIDDYFPNFLTKENALQFLNMNTELPTMAEFNLHKNQNFLASLFSVRQIIIWQNDLISGFDANIDELIALIDKNIQ